MPSNDFALKMSYATIMKGWKYSGVSENDTEICEAQNSEAK